MSEARAHARVSASPAPVARYPVPAAVWAMEPRRHQVIEASAGTGKTYLLERRVVDLLVRAGASIDQVLLVTFTEKATAELRRRTRALVRDVAAARGGDERTLDPHWTIDGAARAGLESALVGFDGAAIHTIHGFCHRVLQSTAFDGRRPLRQTQVAGETALREAFTACMRDTLAVEPDARVLLEAWLAAGRRLDDLPRALGEAMRLGGRLAREYRPDLIDPALAEMATAIAAVNGGLAPVLRAGRVHANTAAAADRRARAMLELAERRQRGCELPQLLDEIDDNAHELADKLSGLASPTVARIAAAAAELARASVPLQAAVVAGFLPAVRERLARDKAERGQFDYGDMLELVWRALSGPGGDDLAARLRARYPFALIDEFQDTDDVQWSIFRRLYLEAPAGSDAWLSVVGDPKQAIYGFRGADVYAYLRARRELLAAGAQETRLDVCYRASAGMIGAVNRVLEDAPFLDPFFSGAIDYAAVRPPERAGAAAVCDGREVEPLCILHVPDAADLDAAGLRARLAGRIVDEIAGILGHGARQDRRLSLRAHGAERALGPGDVFVLTRTVAESREIAERLRRAGVRCALYQQEGLLQTDEAAEVRDLLAAIASPRDGSARLRAWQGRFFAVPLAELPAVAAAGDSHPFVQRLLEWKGLADRLDYEALFPRILEQTRLVEREIALAPSERALTNFLHLFELLLDEMLVARCDLVELVRRLGGWMDDTVNSDERNVQRLESERDAVQIMTIHRAKGLEAAVVFLFGGSGAAPNRQVQAFHRGDERWVHVGKVRDDGDQGGDRGRGPRRERATAVRGADPRGRAPVRAELAGRRPAPRARDGGRPAQRAAGSARRGRARRGSADRGRGGARRRGPGGGGCRCGSGRAGRMAAAVRGWDAGRRRGAGAGAARAARVDHHVLYPAGPGGCRPRRRGRPALRSGRAAVGHAGGARRGMATGTGMRMGMEMTPGASERWTRSFPGGGSASSCTRRSSWYRFAASWTRMTSGRGRRALTSTRCSARRRSARTSIAWRSSGASASSGAACASRSI